MASVLLRNKEHPARHQDKGFEKMEVKAELTQNPDNLRESHGGLEEAGGSSRGREGHRPGHLGLSLQLPNHRTMEPCHP